MDDSGTSEDVARDGQDAPKTWPRGAEVRAALIARYRAWCELTATPPTILSRGLTGNPAFLGRLHEGSEVTLDMYDRCMAGLDVMERIDAIAGGFDKPKRIQGRSPPDGIERKTRLQQRLTAWCHRTGVRHPLLAVALTHDSALLHDGRALSQEQYDIYTARFDAIEAAWQQTRGVPDGPTTETEADAAEAERHRHQGGPVHRSHRDAAGGKEGAL